jgi:hypothetical protein
LGVDATPFVLLVALSSQVSLLYWLKSLCVPSQDLDRETILPLQGQDSLLLMQQLSASNEDEIDPDGLSHEFSAVVEQEELSDKT